MLQNFYKKNYKIIILTFLNICLRGFLLLIPTFIISYIFSFVDKNIDLAQFITIIVVVVFTMILAAILFKIDIYYSRIYLKIINDVKFNILKKLGKSDLYTVTKQGEETYIQNLYNNLSTIKAILFWNVNSTIWHIVMLIITTITIITISIQLASIITSMYILIAVINYIFLNLIKNNRKKQIKFDQIKYKYSEYMISHRYSIFVSNQIEKVEMEYSKIIKNCLRANKRNYLLEQSLINIIEFLKYFGYFLIFYFYYSMNLSIQSIILAIGIYSWTLPLISNIQMHIINLNEANTKGKEIKKYEQEIIKINNDKFKVQEPKIYTKPILVCNLKSLDFRNSDENIIFIQEKSGSGKSTLALALADKYQWKSGKKSNKQYQYFSNEISLPNGYLLELTKYFPVVINEDIQDFLPELNIDNLKNKITLNKLSAGQKSRIILYIASQDTSDYIIFDELLSTIDDFTKQKILKKFQGRKIIIIEHGNSTKKIIAKLS